jgi:hypothetical protein
MSYCFQTGGPQALPVTGCVASSSPITDNPSGSTVTDGTTGNPAGSSGSDGATGNPPSTSVPNDTTQNPTGGSDSTSTSGGKRRA